MHLQTERSRLSEIVVIKRDYGVKFLTEACLLTVEQYPVRVVMKGLITDLVLSMPPLTSFHRFPATLVCVFVAGAALCGVDQWPASAMPLVSSAKQTDNVLRNFGTVSDIGELIVIRDSYRGNDTVREFDAIVNGVRESWWANCRVEALGTQNWTAPWNASTADIHAFVCNDRYTAHSGSPTNPATPDVATNGGGSSGTSYGWETATVSQETRAMAADGREQQFGFYRGERIQVNWGDVRTFYGQQYVSALDSIGQSGFIRADAIDRSPSPFQAANRPVEAQWQAATVLGETTALDANGQVLFGLYQGEPIQVNWSDRRSIAGADYVDAIDSIGQRGYIRTDRIQ